LLATDEVTVASATVTYAATAPLPENVDEYMLAGFLRKKTWNWCLASHNPKFKYQRTLISSLKDMWTLQTI